MEQHLTQYRIFYAVARAGNISRAAKELFISQPAISKSIIQGRIANCFLASDWYFPIRIAGFPRAHHSMIIR